MNHTELIENLNRKAEELYKQGITEDADAITQAIAALCAPTEPTEPIYRKVKVGNVPEDSKVILIKEWFLVGFDGDRAIVTDANGDEREMDVNTEVLVEVIP